MANKDNSKPGRCPHLEEIFESCENLFKGEGKKVERCEDCGHVGENWICLICLTVHCGRYVKAHMLTHGTEKKHPLTLSLSDTSVWCYMCNNYVDDPKLDPFKSAVHKWRENLERLAKTARCSHLAEVTSESALTNIDAKKDSCEECGHVGENWICLLCLTTHCSRYVKGHMLAHGSETKHPITLSFSDISAWCYTCDDYVDDPKLYPFKNAVHKSKFGKDLINYWK